MSNVRHLSDKQSVRPEPADPGIPVFESPAVGAAIAPGMVLRRVLEHRHVTQSELAMRTGLSTKTINQIMLGTAALTPDTALRLERTLAVPSRFWNGLEAAFRDRQARERSAEDVEQLLGWFREFPREQLQGRGAVTRGAAELEQAEEFLAFFGVADPDAYRRVGTATSQPGSAVPSTLTSTSTRQRCGCGSRNVWRSSCRWHPTTRSPSPSCSHSYAP